MFVHQSQIQLLYYSHSVGSAASMGQCDRVLLPPLILMYTMSDVGFAMCHSIKLSQRCLFRPMPGVLPRWVFFFRFEPPTNVFMLVFVIVLAFCFQFPMWPPFSPMGAQPLGLVPPQSFREYLWQAYVSPSVGLWPMSGMHCVVPPSTPLSRGALCYSNSCLPAIQSIWWDIQLWEFNSHPVPLPSVHGRESYSFSGSVPTNYMTASKSVDGVKPGDSIVLICIRLMNLLASGQ